jgi:uncharacterized protein
MERLLIGLVFILHLSCLAQDKLKSIYVCPPCHIECDHLQFEQPGNCPTCGMKLIPNEDLLSTEEFYFTFDNIRYSAEIGRAKNSQPIATIVIIPGHGRTDFVGGGHYYELRQFFSQLGFATLVWDKKGCGKSEGTYEHHQSVENSALEAIAAIEAFKQVDNRASKEIGLWGISRGGWICPLIINGYPLIAFWISVSGTDQFDNFRYMVETNLRIEGRNGDYVKAVMKEWDHYVRVLRNGGESYEQFVYSTEKLFNDPFYISLGEKRVSEAEFNASQEYYRNSGDKFNEETGLRILIADFEKVLNKVECPVLAVFGEMDSQVNWRKARALYQSTIGKNDRTKLEIKSLPDCNHNIMKCETGGLFENLGKYNGEVCDGYYDSMKAWLTKHGFAK